MLYNFFNIRVRKNFVEPMKEVSVLDKKSNSDRIFLIAVGVILTVITVFIRFLVRDILSVDMNIFLLPWYNEYLEAGGFKAIGRTVGDYNYLYYLFMICMTYLPVKAMYAIKALSGLFDYLLAFAVMYLVGILTEKDPRRERFMLASYIAVIFSPLVLENSAVWGQCDSMTAFWVVLALILIIKERYPGSCTALGMALAMKLQMVFIMPLVLYIFIAKFREKKFRFVYFFAIPLVFWLTSVPHIIGGGGILDCFIIYLVQGTGESARLYENSGCFWALFVPDSAKAADEGIVFPTIPFVLVCFAILAAFFIFCYVKKVELSPKNIVCMAFLCIFICVFFLPHMRDRYGYVYEILAIALCFVEFKTLPLLVMIYVSTLARYNHYLFRLGFLPVWASALLNLAALVLYFVLLSKELFPKSSGRSDVSVEDHVSNDPVV